MTGRRDLYNANSAVLEQIKGSLDAQAGNRHTAACSGSEGTNELRPISGAGHLHFVVADAAPIITVISDILGIILQISHDFAYLADLLPATVTERLWDLFTDLHDMLVHAN